MHSCHYSSFFVLYLFTALLIRYNKFHKCDTSCRNYLIQGGAVRGVPLKGFSEIRLAVKGMGRLECGGQHNWRKPLA